MIRVILESPFGGDPLTFIPYGRAAVADSLSLGEAPMAMHLLYTQPGILDDGVEAQRRIGMEAAFSWYQAAEKVVVYRDFGVSPGMQAGIDLGVLCGLQIDYRSLRGRSFRGDLLWPFPDRYDRTDAAPGVYRLPPPETG